MHARIRQLLGAAVVVGTSACLDDGDADRVREVSMLRQELEQLRGTVALETTRVRALEHEKATEALEEVAVVRPGDAGYAVGGFELGGLTFKIRDVKPYAAGSRVSLMVGNPLGAVITGLEMEVEWGRTKGDLTAPADGRTSVTITQELQPGKWNTVAVVLDAVPPTELGFLRLRNIDHKGLRLRQ
jgi:hypothetical protein